ncbi:MAG: PEP-CTERM sorting domain-containing protein [Planctomycetota bacterium]|nr:PEP-CTERM sorting domain-containing protein [Planctomycetota bacterium]
MICLSIIGIQAKANAGTITLADQNLTDAMSITGQTGMTHGVTVAEKYAESTWIPYSTLVPIEPDAGNYAVVTPGHTYFDAIVNFSGFTSNEIGVMTFQITNSTPHNWTDYHFEIWNTSFTVRAQGPWAFPNPPTFSLPLASDQFTGLTIHPRFGSLYSLAGSGELHEKGVTGIYTLRMQLFSFANSSSGAFGLRQVATITPEPASMAIFGIGGSMLMYVRRRRSRLASHGNGPI